MDVSKLTAQDAETLAEFKRTKAPLGVIHPVHAMVRRPEAEGTPDLTVTATPIKPSIKPQVRIPIPDHLLRSKPQVSSPHKPPEGHLAPKNFMPGFKRPKSAKEQREVQSIATQILASLPMQVKKQAMHRKLSILTKKDARTSTEEYLGKVRRNLNKKTAKKLLKEDVRRDGGQVMAALDTAFTHLSVSETQYQAARTELEELVDAIENQLWKEKALSRFMHKTQVGEVTIIKLKRLLHQQQVEREGSLIAMQKLLYGLRQWKSEIIELGPGGLTFTFGDLETFLQENTGKMTPEDRNGVSLYLDRLRKYLQKQASVKAIDVIPMSILEKILEDLFNKWDGERIIIEGVIQDIENAISQEEHLRSEMKLGAGAKDLELKVVAEFINQYFDKLEESIQKKKDGIQRILERLKSGKEKPEAWGDIIRKMKETVENEDLEREWTLLNKEAELVKKQEKNRKKESEKPRENDPGKVSKISGICRQKQRREKHEAVS